MTILDLLTNNANKYSNETALIELSPDDQKRIEITWKNFDDTTNRIANALLEMGIRENDKVAMLMRNSIKWLEIYFGILKTGAWVVPLNFRFTSSDIKYCMNISEAKIFILDNEFISRVTEVENQLHTIQYYINVGESINNKRFYNFEDIILSSKPNYPQIEITDSHECGLYFTSGTTGAPKPILLTHSNMFHAAITEQKHHHQIKEDNFILIPPLYHAGAKMHWFGNLMVGAKATLIKKVTPQYIFETIQIERGTIVWLLVPWAHDILAALDNGQLKISDYDLSSWRLMHIGAQPVPPSLVKRWQEYFPNMEYDNNYGLSEATGPGCVHLGLENKHKIDSIGKAGYGWQAKIVRDDGSDVETSEVGELIVKGGGVMKEYYKNEEKTRETIKDGWLYTGDMAKMDADGFIYIVDRKKDIIISGGENIYPVEIEEVLHTHKKIQDVAVIGIPDERLGEVPVAVIQPKNGITIDREEIMKFCEEQLPRYKRPKSIIIDEVPRGPTGKIEKTKLRAKYTLQPTN